MDTLQLEPSLIINVLLVYYAWKMVMNSYTVARSCTKKHFCNFLQHGWIMLQCKITGNRQYTFVMSVVISSKNNY